MLFAEIPGHESLKRRMINGVENSHIPHAQLFSGAEGSASLALAVAYCQYIACENKQQDDSCGKCASCIKMNKLIHPDLHFSIPTNWEKPTELLCTEPFLLQWREAFLNNPFLSIDEWSQTMNIGDKKPFISAYEGHQIIKALQYFPVESEYKFMIIWLPENMNLSAANRILKTLEEPTSKTLIILVSQEFESLLTTIRSRTQITHVLPFSPADAASVLVNRFGKAPDESLQIAEIAEGNLAEAIWMMEHGDEASLLLELFRNWMQFCYGFKIDSLSKFAETIHKKGREWHKGFLSYCLYMIRQTVIMNHSPELNRITQEEALFISKFRLFFHEGNYEQITEHIDEAAKQISRNGSAKIIFFDVSLIIAEIFKRERSLKQSPA